MTHMIDVTVLAYLDPGTGSMVLQLLVGGILGGAFLIKLQWLRIKSLFKRDKSGSGESIRAEDIPSSDQTSQ